MKIRSKRHPKPARPRDPGDHAPASDDQAHAHAIDAGPRSIGEGRVKRAQRLKAASRRLERTAMIADILNALADLFRL